MRIIAVLLIASCMGCASTYKTISYSDKVQQARNIVEVKASSWNGDSKASIGVDLIALAKSDTGYFAAWKADPGGMTFATIIDAVAVGGTAYLLKETQDKEKTIVQAPPTYSINANNVILGNNNTMTFAGE